MARCNSSSNEAHLLLELLQAEVECTRAGIQFEKRPCPQLTLDDDQRAAFDKYKRRVSALAGFMLGGGTPVHT